MRESVVHFINFVLAYGLGVAGLPFRRDGYVRISDLLTLPALKEAVEILGLSEKELPKWARQTPGSHLEFEGFCLPSPESDEADDERHFKYMVRSLADQTETLAGPRLRFGACWRLPPGASSADSGKKGPGSCWYNAPLHATYTEFPIEVKEGYLDGLEPWEGYIYDALRREFESSTFAANEAWRSPFADLEPGEEDPAIWDAEIQYTFLDGIREHTQQWLSVVLEFARPSVAASDRGSMPMHVQGTQSGPTYLP
jgi:hypothetical protein